MKSKGSIKGRVCYRNLWDTKQISWWPFWPTSVAKANIHTFQLHRSLNLEQEWGTSDSGAECGPQNSPQATHRISPVLQPRFFCLVGICSWSVVMFFPCPDGGWRGKTSDFCVAYNKESITSIAPPTFGHTCGPQMVTHKGRWPSGWKTFLPLIQKNLVEAQSHRYEADIAKTVLE